MSTNLPPLRKRSTLTLGLALGAAALGLAVAVPALAQSGPMTAKAVLKPTTAPGAEGVSGEMTLTQKRRVVTVEGTVRGLEPGSSHGFHVHEKADCSGDGKAAGEHFNPDQEGHGNPRQKMRHPGAMINLRADGAGTATFRQNVDIITLAPGRYSVKGLPLVVHAKADDYKSQPSGNAGDRIACGLIE